MKDTYSINIRRLLLLFRNCFIYDKGLLIAAAVFSAILILSRIANAFSEDAYFSYGPMFFLFLYISGFILTIGFNIELHDKRKPHAWLLFPASTLEKFITLLLLPTIFLSIGLAIYMTVMSHLIEFGVALFFDTEINGFNPFSIIFLKQIVVYFAIQAPFLMGAIYFKKHAMSYTFLILFIWGAMFWIFSFLLGMFFLGDHLTPLLPGFGFIDGVVELRDIDTLYAMTLLEKLKYAMDFWKPLATIYYWVLSPILWWAIAFFSLKEMEQ